MIEPKDKRIFLEVSVWHSLFLLSNKPGVALEGTASVIEKLIHTEQLGVLPHWYGVLVGKTQTTVGRLVEKIQPIQIHLVIVRFSVGRAIRLHKKRLWLSEYSPCPEMYTQSGL